MRAAISTEWLKLRRSPVIWVITALVALVIPLMSYAMSWVATNGGFGPLAAKTSALVVGEGWEGYLNALGQMATAGVFIAIGVAVAWVFGREYVDQTFPSLFAVAVSRPSIAYAKFVVTSLWATGTCAAMILVVGAIGLFAGLEAPSTMEAAAGLLRLFLIVILTSGLGLTSAAVATRWRGYLPAVAGLILVVAIAQMAVLFGTGGWFTFAVPGLMAVAGTEGVPVVTGTQLTLIPVVIAASVWVTARMWLRAEVI